MTLSTLLIILTLSGLILPLILFSLRAWISKVNSSGKYVLYDPSEHKEYHIFGKLIFSAKCAHPARDWYKVEVKIFDTTNSYFVYTKENSSGIVITQEIDKFVDSPTEYAIETGIIDEDGKLTRKGLINSIFLYRDAKEAVVPVMRKKKFIDPVIEIKN